MKNIDDYRGKALVFTTKEEQVETKLFKTLNTELAITKEMFHSMGTKSKPSFYPRKELTNQIGSGMGIEFSDAVKMEPVYGDEVQYSDGRIVKPVCGIRCIKQGKRRRPDGTWQPSSPCSYVFNWADRAEEDFLNDYDNIGQKWPDNNPKARYNFPDNPNKQNIARKKRVLELKKFADQRASTGAELMVIRELTGMATAFTPQDVAKGVMVVSQIAKSEEYQEAEARARIDNIRHGGLVAQNVNAAASLLTGKDTNITADFSDKFERPDSTPPEFKDKGKEDIKEKSPLIIEYEKLMEGGVISEDGLAHYKKQVTDNNYCDAVLKWAIDDIKQRFYGGQQ